MLPIVWFQALKCKDLLLFCVFSLGNLWCHCQSEKSDFTTQIEHFLHKFPHQNKSEISSTDSTCCCYGHIRSRFDKQVPLNTAKDEKTTLLLENTCWEKVALPELLWACAKNLRPGWNGCFEGRDTICNRSVWVQSSCEPAARTDSAWVQYVGVSKLESN